MLFKSQNNKEISEIRKYCTSFGATTDFRILVPYIRQAEQDYIIPFLSQEQYDLIEPAYQDGSISGKNAQLCEKVQAALAYFVAYLCSNNNSLSLVDMGNMESTPQNSAPSRQWVLYRFQESVVTIAYSNLDAMIKYLEVNKGDFAAWSGSESFTITHDLFINTTADFNAVVNINKSHQVFIALRPFIKEAQLRYIEPLLGTELYDELIEGIESGDPPSPEASLLIKKINNALAYLSIVESLPVLNVQITTLGIRIHSISDGIISSMVADQDARTAYSNKMYELGNMNLARLREFLEKNATDYPLYVSLASQEVTQEYKMISSCEGKVVGF